MLASIIEKWGPAGGKPVNMGLRFLTKNTGDRRKKTARRPLAVVFESKVFHYYLIAVFVALPIFFIEERYESVSVDDFSERHV